jgi:hypothetical protein
VLRVLEVLTVLVLGVLEMPKWTERMTRRALVLVAPLAPLALLAPAPLAPPAPSAPLAPQPPSPSARDGVITGQVVDAVSGKPVSAVVVSITGTLIPARIDVAVSQPGTMAAMSSSVLPRILTGADGRFLFRDLPAGTFTITATKGGYADGASGRLRPGGATQPVVLVDTLRAADVTVRMWKNGAIGGTVIDEAGEPIVGVQLRALARTISAGRPRFAASGPPAVTDDRGVYRFSNLTAGDYLIVASAATFGAQLSVASERPPTSLVSPMSPLAGAPAAIEVGDALYALGRGSPIPPPPVDGRLLVYPTTFYPAATVPAQATTITLGSGEERTAIDLQLQPVPTARVSGTLVSPTGPASQTAIRLIPSGFEDVPLGQDSHATTTDATGSFTFPALPAGQYRLRAESDGSGQPGASACWLDTPITVAGSDIEGIVAALRPGLRISVRLEFQGSAEHPRAQSVLFTAVPVALESTDASSFNTRVSGGFEERGLTLAGYPPGEYFGRVAQSPPGWMFKSAMLNGVDVSETPFELTRDVTDLVVTFTDRWSGIGGVVRSPQGTADGNATVVVFPTNADAWTNYSSSSRRLRNARTNAKGEFGMSSVPPGDYYVVAIPEERSADWRDPKMLETLARSATEITIVEGEHKMIDLRLHEVKQ